MRRRSLAALVLTVALALGVAAASLAQDAGTAPQVVEVTPTTAHVTAVVEPPGGPGTYRFEWGTDETFGATGEPIALGVETGPRPVAGVLTGLQPATTYLVRVVVTGAGDPVAGPAATFTTPPGDPPADPEPAVVPVETPGTEPDPADAEQGEAVVLGAETGTVTVKQAGTEQYARLAPGAPVPVGSLVDATAGTVRVVAAAPRGRTQEVLVRDGKFEVRQSRGGDGVTDLVLRGENFATCRRAASAGRRTKRPRRTLWARGRGGRFRTRGLNSVATVRGTTWRTTDTCRGTTTTVSSGAVVLRELRTGRRLVLRAGDRHLARADAPMRTKSR